MQERKLTVRVSRIQRETPEILSLELSHPYGRALPAYEAGAHIDVHMPGGFSRQYSLAKACDGSSSYVIGVKREPASRGGSASLHSRVKEGDLIAISSPRNAFSLNMDASHHLLMAGGIGITPMLAMAHTLQRAGKAFTLCVFARSLEHVAFASEVQQGALAPHARLFLDDDGQRADLAQLLAAQTPHTHVYMCGPAGFMAAIRSAAAGWAEERIHAEYFAAPTDATTQAGQAFTLKLSKRGISIPVAADQTAVDALHDFGIDIPVSCEQGLCGTCVVNAVGDDAEHRDFCLTTTERAHKVALCCSRAKKQEMTIHL